ncbi:hypothetical protein NE852_13425 [Rhizobium sp. Pop5]|uniref:hypothetical protein n=1 Tax=Rhizobium sp. Pop5 TaxID=1223565 RepID=UPI002157F4BD|nr:hypothetical protein [Rhizobium sp. Pop5]UVD55108.1 hypothetical protein NE852_13425 [Rhizobium sp. Pop5]
MNLTTALARDAAVTEALRAVDEAIGDEPPGEQAFRIIAAIKALRPDRSPEVAELERVDYLETAQRSARAAWNSQYAAGSLGPECDAVAGIDTPIGRLKAVTWRRPWRNGRIAWASEYYLDDAPVSIAEIRAAGLAQRPTTRNRRRG